MGRRKKEPKSVHRAAISSAAATLFSEKGVEHTSMDEIAKQAGYSKATLYVYFKNKEEIISILVLESMKKLHTYLTDALQSQSDMYDKYIALCNAMLKYEEEFPFYFHMVLDEINIDFENTDYIPEDKETFLIGEKINTVIKDFLIAGINAGEFRKDLKILPTIFSFWGMITGLIELGSNKETYINQTLHCSKQDFLNYGFDTLYRSISVKGVPYEN